MAPAMTLKRMYHWVPSSIRRIAASESPPGSPTRASNRMGKSAVAGMEATTCTTGCRRRDHFGERPMATPAGTVQATPISRAVNVRSQVARVARSSVPQVGKGTWTSSRNMDTSPRRTSAPSRPASTHPAIRRGDGKREDCSGDNACAQYISNRDKGCGLGQQFGALRSHQDDHKIFKALPRFKRLRWGQIALLGFVFLIDLLDLPTSDAQASLRQQVTSQPLEEALGVPPLHGWLLLTSLIGDRFADLKNRFGKTQAIGVQLGLQGRAIHQGADGIMHHEQRVELLAHAFWRVRT